MSFLTEGTVGVSITAGHIKANQRTYEGRAQLLMGTGAAFVIHISPETAEQWIGVLKTITEEKEIN